MDHWGTYSCMRTVRHDVMLQLVRLPGCVLAWVQPREAVTHSKSRLTYGLPAQFYLLVGNINGFVMLAHRFLAWKT